jgi:GTP cyclohydrolase III
VNQRSDSGFVYLLADGDSIGDRLELFLLDGHVEKAADFSDRLRQALETLASALEKDLRGKIIFTGGDDVLALVPAALVSEEACRELQSAYHDICGCTLSVGVGHSPDRAVGALRRAKLLGKNRAVFSRE